MNILSVVLPVRNRAKRVVATLESMGIQNAPVDYILVDNDSTDSTLEVLREWADRINADSSGANVRVLSNSQPGAAATRNAGLKAVRTEYVLFFDSDDVMRPGHLNRVIDYLRANPETDILGFTFVLHLPSGKVTRQFHMTDTLFHGMFHGGFATLLWCVRTALLRRAGGWNAGVRLWDDMEVMVRVMEARPHARMGFIPEISADIHPTGDSITQSTITTMLKDIEPALNSISRHLPVEKRVWVEYLRIINAGNVSRHGGENKSRSVVRDVLRRNRHPRHRWLLRFAYIYSASGFRGAARIIRKFI